MNHLHGQIDLSHHALAGSHVGGGFIEIYDDVYISEKLDVDLIQVKALMHKAKEHIRQTFNSLVPPVFFVVDEQDAPPYANYVPERYGYIFLSLSDLTNLNVIVHEMVHCAISSGHRFFDEGLAVYAERTLDIDGWYFYSQPRRYSYISLFSSKEWSEYLDEFPLGDRDPMYEIAARVIRVMLESGGILNLKKFLFKISSLEDSPAICELFENMFNIMIMDLDEKLNLSGTDAENLISKVGKDNSVAKLYREVTSDFLLGRTENASKMYSRLKGCKVESKDDEMLFEIARLRVLTLAAFDENENQESAIKNWKKEALYFISENKESLESYLLELHLQLNELKASSNPVAMVDKIFTLLETALALHPSSIELHVFKFKLMINDPRENSANIVAVLDEFQNDAIYGSEIVGLLNKLK